MSIKIKGIKNGHPCPPHQSGSVDLIVIPDCWHAAMALPEPHQSMVIEAWTLAHRLLDHAKKGASE